MARIKLESIIEYHDSDIRRAIDDAVNNVTNSNDIDSYELFRAFKRSVSRRFSTWVRVPDQYVEKDQR